MIYVEIKRLEREVTNNTYTRIVSDKILRFENKESYSSDGIWKLNHNMRFVYGYYKGILTSYRVHNVSSKPIVHKERKVLIHKRIKAEIIKLEEKKRKLFEEVDGL